MDAGNPLIKSICHPDGFSFTTKRGNKDLLQGCTLQTTFSMAIRAFNFTHTFPTTCAIDYTVKRCSNKWPLTTNNKPMHSLINLK